MEGAKLMADMEMIKIASGERTRNGAIDARCLSDLMAVDMTRSWDRLSCGIASCANEDESVFR